MLIRSDSFRKNQDPTKRRLNNLDELLDFAVGPVTDELYRHLLERDYIQDDPEIVMVTAAPTNVLEHKNSAANPIQVWLMAA